MERSPRAPVFLSMARCAMDSRAPFVKLRSTLSIPKSIWNWGTSAFLGSVRILTSIAVDNEWNGTRIGNRPTNSFTKREREKEFLRRRNGERFMALPGALPAREASSEHHFLQLTPDLIGREVRTSLFAALPLNPVRLPGPPLTGIMPNSMRSLASTLARRASFSCRSLSTSVPDVWCATSAWEAARRPPFRSPTPNPRYCKERPINARLFWRTGDRFKKN